MFVALDETIQRATSEVLAQHPLLMKATKNRNGADPFVIATARVRSLSSPRRRAERRASPRYPRYAKPSASHASTCSASSETRAGVSRSPPTALPGFAVLHGSISAASLPGNGRNLGVRKPCALGGANGGGWLTRRLLCSGGVRFGRRW
jgi:hypothetical protein